LNNIYYNITVISSTNQAISVASWNVKEINYGDRKVLCTDNNNIVSIKLLLIINYQFKYILLHDLRENAVIHKLKLIKITMVE